MRAPRAIPGPRGPTHYPRGPATLEEIWRVLLAVAAVACGESLSREVITWLVYDRARAEAFEALVVYCRRKSDLDVRVRVW